MKETTEIFPKYINVATSDWNCLMTYMLYDIKNNADGTQTGEYRAPSAFSAYPSVIKMTKYDYYYMQTNNCDEHAVRYDHILPTTVFRFLRTNASFIDFPGNRELIDDAMEDARAILKLFFPIRIVEDGTMYGLTSKKIEPFATINYKIIDFKNRLTKFI